ncbi:G protein coupled receptor fragment [Echinococcus multilocularis]|uniref:G protein coupled receptor n=1 Tax=Echinococcus multilocularis TaxID=6211 RepID=A0A068Y792_ECHMU|nr:G protein coupled receptor fragment [Echinococcus multilocularis]
MLQSPAIETNLSVDLVDFQKLEIAEANGSLVLNVDFLASQHHRDLIGHYLMGIATLTISCIGLVGNVLSIGILTSKYMRGTTTNQYLIALAASDSMMLFFAILVAIRDARRPKYGVPVWQLWDDASFVPHLYPICHAFALLFQVCSNWLTAAFTADRYLMICYPFIAKRWCTLRLSKLVIAAVWVASFCYTLPRFYEYAYFTPLPHPAVRDSRLHLPNHWYQLSAMGDSKAFRFGYHLWAWCILVIGLPSLFIAVLNIFLVREINRSIKRMRFEQGIKTRRHETDVMLIGVIVIFFVCQIPSSVSHVMWGIRGYRQEASVPWLILNEVGNLFVILNASINIIPYYLFGKRFRTLFVIIYFGWMKRCADVRQRVTSLNHLLTPTLNRRPRQPSASSSLTPLAVATASGQGRSLPLHYCQPR